MQKAYDAKVLIQKAKEKGLELTEDMALLLVDLVIDWLDESAIASENVYDDILRAVYPLAKQQLKIAANKIDGKVG